jgi:hypothetical protein
MIPFLGRTFELTRPKHITDEGLAKTGLKNYRQISSEDWRAWGRR